VKEISGDTKVDSSQVQRRHGLEKVFLQVKGLSCSGVATAHNSPQIIKIMRCA
jgi:hypothetical protein